MHQLQHRCITPRSANGEETGASWLAQVLVCSRAMRGTSSLGAALLAVGLGFVATTGCGDDDEPPPSGLSCVGEQCNLECPPDDPTCQAECRQGADCDLNCNGVECDLDCASKSTCNADCREEGGCDADCEGQSDCNVDCTLSGDCNLDCAGGSRCDIQCKENCGGGCAGTSECNLGCDGACGVGCTGESVCSLSCRTGCFVCCQGSATCNLTCTEAETTECTADDGTRILVCGRECPAADECKYGDT